MVDKLPISVIILSFNDERLIRPALESVRDWSGEIFVVDSGSTDHTIQIAREFTDQVVSHPFENYAAQRNWAQSTLRLTHEWVLHLDADERVTPELRTTLSTFFDSDDKERVDGLLVARRTVFMGRWIRHGGHYPVYHLRIFRHAKGRCEERLYDQHFVVTGLVKKVQGDLIDTITTDLDSWSHRHIRWAHLEAQQQSGQRITPETKPELLTQASLTGNPIERRRWLRSNVFERQPLFWRALAYFCYRYFFRLGILDGTEGLIFHFLQGFWFRFYIDAKLWEARYTLRANVLSRKDQAHPDNHREVI